MKEIVLFLISAMPVVLLGIYIYKKDRSKEPVELLIKLFFCCYLFCNSCFNN